MNWHVVLRRGWQDISGIVTPWLDHFDTIAVADHSPDEEAKSFHCHLIIIGYRATSKNNPQRDKYSRLFPDFRGRGEHSWMDTQGSLKEPVTLEGGLRYILKGGDESKARLVYVKNVPLDQIEIAKQSWVTYDPVETAKQNPAQRAWKTCISMMKDRGYNCDTPVLEMAQAITETLDELGYDFSRSKRQGMLDSLISRFKPVYRREVLKRLTIPKPEFWGDAPW